MLIFPGKKIIIAMYIMGSQQMMWTHPNDMTSCLELMTDRHPNERWQTRKMMKVGKEREPSMEMKWKSLLEQNEVHGHHIEGDRGRWKKSLFFIGLMMTAAADDCGMWNSHLRVTSLSVSTAHTCSPLAITCPIPYLTAFHLAASTQVDKQV